jgi:hypothetical protein
VPGVVAGPGGGKLRASALATPDKSGNNRESEHRRRQIVEGDRTMQSSTVLRPAGISNERLFSKC